jgi:hypothetical protein
VAQAVSPGTLTAEVWVRSQVSPRKVCGEQCNIGTGFSPITSVLPCQCHCTSAPYLSSYIFLLPEEQTCEA